MTERLCATCGHVEYWHGEGSVPLPHPKSGPACARCMEQNDVDPWHDFSPPEAAPSTDEGEAQDEREDEFLESEKQRYAHTCHLCGRLDLDEAAIRAPLEERIRERDYTVNLLEAEASQFRTIIGRERAEVERLREALRTIASWGVDPANRAGELSLIFQYAERALATPPSSTEGTDDEPTFDRLSMHRSEDWGTKEVEG